jgi:hypothetical protein
MHGSRSGWLSGVWRMSGIDEGHVDFCGEAVVA